jgi:DNA-directed RNA polymerase specialized sigma24 family protein
MMGPEAFSQLVDEHTGALVLYARQWCAAPEDVVQEALLKLVAQKKEPDHPIAWLYRVVRNAAISASRSAKRRQHHETFAASRAPSWFVPCEGGGLDVGSASAALRELPLEQRESIVAHLWGGLTFEQIGSLTGCSSSTAHRRYLEGLSVLRKKLEKPCPSQPPIRN